MSQQDDTELQHVGDQELRGIVRDLQVRLVELEATVDQHDRLLDAIEFRNDGQPSEAALQDVWVAGVPLGIIADKANERSKDNASRVDALERGEVDTAAVGTGQSDDLPIQRMRADVKAGRDDLDRAHVRATEIWARFLDDADPSQGTYTLSSAKVKRIFTEEGYPSHPEARKRAMQALAGASDGLIDVVKRDNTLTLRADKDDLDAVLHAQQKAVETTEGDDG